MRHSPPARISAPRVATAVASSAAALTLGASALPAAAQQVSGGATATLAALFVRGVDTAADTSGNYLALGGQGTLVGVCINAGGAAITGAMTINASASGYASFPRAVYAGSGNFPGRLGRGSRQSRRDASVVCAGGELQRRSCRTGAGRDHRRVVGTGKPRYCVFAVQPARVRRLADAGAHRYAAV